MNRDIDTVEELDIPASVWNRVGHLLQEKSMTKDMASGAEFLDQAETPEYGAAKIVNSGYTITIGDSEYIWSATSGWTRYA